MILRKFDRPRKSMRVTSLVTPIVGALLALGFMTAPAANQGLLITRQARCRQNLSSFIKKPGTLQI